MTFGITSKNRVSCAIATIVIAAIALSAVVLMDIFSFDDKKPATKPHKARAAEGNSAGEMVKHGHAVTVRRTITKTLRPKAKALLTSSKAGKKRMTPKANIRKIINSTRVPPFKAKETVKTSRDNLKTTFPPVNAKEAAISTTNHLNTTFESSRPGNLPSVPSLASNGGLEQTSKSSSSAVGNATTPGKTNSDSSYPLKNDAGTSTGGVTPQPSVKARPPEDRRGAEYSARSKRVLLCTVGDRATTLEMMPPDGLCDLLFYTNVIWVDDDIQSLYGHERTWAAFQSSSLMANSTGHGISLDYWKAGGFLASLATPVGQTKMMELYKKKIRHYGILKAFGKVAHLLNDMHGKLGVLKVLRQMQNYLASQDAEHQVPLELVLGVKFHSYNSPIDISQHSSAMTALANHLPITVFIVHTHIADWNVGSPALLGTVWYYGSSVAHVPNEPSLRRTALELTEASIPSQTCVMASFSMVVGEFQRTEWQADNNGRLASMARKDVTQLCKKQFGFSVINEGILKVSAENDLSSFTYEDVETMNVKAKAFFKIYNHVRQGWAVFDADYEDYANECGNGTFSRLRALKATLANIGSLQ